MTQLVSAEPRASVAGHSQGLAARRSSSRVFKAPQRAELATASVPVSPARLSAEARSPTRRPVLFRLLQHVAPRGCLSSDWLAALKLGGSRAGTAAHASTGLRTPAGPRRTRARGPQPAPSHSGSGRRPQPAGGLTLSLPRGG